MFLAFSALIKNARAIKLEFSVITKQENKNRQLRFKNYKTAFIVFKIVIQFSNFYEYLEIELVFSKYQEKQKNNKKKKRLTIAST